jgi:membrane protease YdiL (CAAX protease family)
MKNLSETKLILSVFLFSWLFWGIGIASGQPSTMFPNLIFYMLGGSGPSLVALFYVFRYFDRETRQDFWARLVDHRRLSRTAWTLCLFGIPVLILAAIAIDSLFSGQLASMPNLQMLAAQPAVIPMFVVMMLIGGALSEELGWRGILLDRLQQKWSPLLSSLILALVWWAFHLPLFFLRGTTHYEWGLFSPMFWLFLLNVLPLTACLTLAYNHTRRSILSAVLIHFSYNFALALLVPISVRAYAILAVFLFVAFVLIARLLGWSEASDSTDSVLYHQPSRMEPR